MSNVLKELKEKALPKPVSLTAEEIRQVAAGTAAALAAAEAPTRLTGYRPPSE